MRVDLTQGFIDVHPGADAGEIVFVVLENIEESIGSFEVRAHRLFGVRTGMVGGLHKVEYRLNQAAIPSLADYRLDSEWPEWVGDAASVTVGETGRQSLLRVTFNLRAPGHMAERKRGFDGWALLLFGVLDEELPAGPITRVIPVGYDPKCIRVPEEYELPKPASRFEREVV